MTTTPAPTDHDTLKALLDAMPEGPWRVAQSQPHPGIRTAAGWEVVWATYADTGPQVLEFVAAARNALPALLTTLDEIDRARDHAEFELDQMRMERDAAREELAKTRAELAEAEQAREKLTLTVRAFPHAANAANIAHARAQRDEAWAAITKVRDYIARHWADESAFDCEAGACNCLRFARDVLFVECGVRNDKGYSCTEFPNHVGDHVAMGQKTPDDEPFETARWPQDANPATTAEPAVPHCGLCGSETCPGKPGTGCSPGPYETYEPGTKVTGTTQVWPDFADQCVTTHTGSTWAGNGPPATTAEPAAREVTLAEAAQQARLNLIEAEQRRIAAAEPDDEQQPECVQTGTCCSTCLHDLGECCKPGHADAEPADEPKATCSCIVQPFLAPPRVVHLSTCEAKPAREQCEQVDCHNFGGWQDVCGTGPLFTDAEPAAS